MEHEVQKREPVHLYPVPGPAGGGAVYLPGGDRKADRAEALLPACDSGIQTLYRTAGGAGGDSRWLMIAVTSDRILEDVKALLQIRVKPPKK